MLDGEKSSKKNKTKEKYGERREERHIFIVWTGRDFTEKVIEINTWRSWDKSWISVEGELSEHRADLEGSNMPTTFSDQKEAGVSESNGQRRGRMLACREWKSALTL